MCTLPMVVWASQIVQIVCVGNGDTHCTCVQGGGGKKALLAAADQLDWSFLGDMADVSVLEPRRVCCGGGGWWGGGGWGGVAGGWGVGV